MDYDSREVKWYWLILFSLYCGAVGYLLFSGNPYLYSNKELIAALSSADLLQKSVIPAKPDSPPRTGVSTFFERYNFERTGVDPAGVPRLKNYVEYQKYEVKTGLDDFEFKSVVSDDSGFYVTGKSPWVVAIGLNGEARWRFRFRDLKAEQSLLPVLLDESSAYLVHPEGEIVCLNKTDGSIRWVLETDLPVAGTPFLWQGHVIVPFKAAKEMQLLQVQRTTGIREKATPKLDAKPGFILSYSPVLKALIAAFDNKVVAIDPDNWNSLWTQTLTDPIKGPAVVVENMIYVATLGAKLVKIDGGKKGKVEWEVDLEKPPASAPSFVPAIQRLTILDTSGMLSAVDLKTGKVAWTYSTENKNPLTDTWSVRLSAKYIEEFKMDWLHKGWTVWSPCSNKRFCIFTPNKGQLMERVSLSGTPVTLPLQTDHGWMFLTETKPGQLAILHVMSENDIKKLKAEQAKAAEAQ